MLFQECVPNVVAGVASTLQGSPTLANQSPPGTQLIIPLSHPSPIRCSSLTRSVPQQGASPAHQSSVVAKTKGADPQSEPAAATPRPASNHQTTEPLPANTETSGPTATIVPLTQCSLPADQIVQSTGQAGRHSAAVERFLGLSGMKRHVHRVLAIDDIVGGKGFGAAGCSMLQGSVVRPRHVSRAHISGARVVGQV